MLNVSNAIKQAYINGNANTSIFLTVGETVYTPTNILSGSVSITESLCSAEQFTLSAVEKNSIEFSLININEGIKDLQGKNVIATQHITVNGEETVIPLGRYTIVDAINDGQYIVKCTAYESSALALDTIIDVWWNTTVGLFPTTTRGLLIALLDYLGLQYDIDDTFTNSNYVIAKRPVYFEGVTAAEVLGYIQEVSCAFFKADRDGVIRIYRPFKSALYPHNGLYPSLTLYPKHDINTFTLTHPALGSLYHDGLYPHDGIYPGMSLYPKETTYSYYFGEQEYQYPQIVGDLVVSDFETAPVEKVQVRGTEDDIGIIVGSGTNTYVIQGNPLLFNLTDATGRPIVTNIYNELKGFTYVPFSGKFMGMPFVEVGDMVYVYTLSGLNVGSPVLNRVLNGAKLTFDEFTTDGIEELEENASVNRSVQVLAQKTHEVINTVSQFSSTITEIRSDVDNLEGDVETLSSQIIQTADQIQSTVARASKTYDTTGYTITYYGYGVPTNEKYPPSSNNGKYYLDANNGNLYYCNGSAWSLFATLPLITTELQTQITQTAEQIQSTVAKATKTYDTSGLQYTLDYYNYGTPSNSVYPPASNNGKHYLNVDNGDVYVCNGSAWSKIATLTLITTNLQSQITQSADNIALVVSGTGANAKVNAASIVAQINADGTSETQINSDKIKVTGSAYFLSPSDVGGRTQGGVTYINGGKIKTGNIQLGGTVAQGFNTDGKLEVYKSNGNLVGSFGKDGITIDSGTITSPTINSATINSSEMWWQRGETFGESHLSYGSITIDGTIYSGIKINSDAVNLITTSGAFMAGDGNAAFIFTSPSTAALDYRKNSTSYNRGGYIYVTANGAFLTVHPQDSYDLPGMVWVDSEHGDLHVRALDKDGSIGQMVPYKVGWKTINGNRCLVAYS